MHAFDKVYPFTTENIKGYLKHLNLKNKKILTVNGSGDHLLNLILKGANTIHVFDINSSSLEYTKEKLEYIKNNSYKSFICNFLDKKENQIYKKYKMEFKYFDKQNKINNNLYLNKNNYKKLQEKIKNVKIKYINKNILDLNLKEEYDYLFLSNISDYINDLYKNNCLNNYSKLIIKLLKNIKIIYFAYIYDVDKKIYRSDIDNLKLVRIYFPKIKIKKFNTALLNSKNKDAVLIVERKCYYGK